MWVSLSSIRGNGRYVACGDDFALGALLNLQNFWETDLAARLRRRPELNVVEADVLRVDFRALAEQLRFTNAQLAAWAADPNTGALDGAKRGLG